MTLARVNFVVCPSFHGATLLALLLNNHSKIAALGDTNPSREYDQVCACRQKVSGCDFWRTLSARLDADRFSNGRSLLPELPWPFLDRRLDGDSVPISRNDQVNRIVGRVASRVVDRVLSAAWRDGSHAVAEYVQIWSAFYRAVADIMDVPIVVDGTKSARKASLISRELGDKVGARVIHLVRDPRGFAASSLRYQQGDNLHALGSVWAAVHKRMSRLANSAPYHVVRYEDLALRPSREVDAVFRFLGVQAESVVAAPKYPTKHHLMGNAMIFGFDGNIRLDERWRGELTRKEQRTVLDGAGHVAQEFGYA